MKDNLTVLDIMSSIDYALPAIEIVGSRIKDWDIKITDTIADNASASHYVGRTFTTVTLDEFDVVDCHMTMSKNGEMVSHGKGRGLPGLSTKMQPYG